MTASSESIRMRQKSITMKQLCNISVLLMMGLSSCAYQQLLQHDRVMAEVIHYNDAHINELHTNAVKTHRESYTTYRNLLTKAEKAAWVRERGDCCCTGAELDPLSPSPLSKKEFREVVELLSQAQAEPAPRREDMKPEKLASAMWHEETGWQMNLEPAHMIIMPPGRICRLTNSVCKTQREKNSSASAMISTERRKAKS